MNECKCLLRDLGSLARHREYISRDYHWLITCAAVYTGPEGLKAWTTDETVVKSEVAFLKKMPSIL